MSNHYSHRHPATIAHRAHRAAIGWAMRGDAAIARGDLEGAEIATLAAAIWADRARDAAASPRRRGHAAQRHADLADAVAIGIAERAWAAGAGR